MKNFKKFLEEVDIKGNPGIPGEPNKKPGESSYLNDVEGRAKQRLRINPQDSPRMTPMGPIPSEKEIRLGRRVMNLLPKSMQFTARREDEFSKLATDMIYNLYKDIIDRYNVELDIKLVRPGQVKPFMDESEEGETPPPRFKKITDENVIREIHKRKLANLIIQGEAKNTKHILHSDEAKEGFNKILGDNKGRELFETLDELTKIADQLDWIIPEEIKAQMMKQMPDGLAGACHVDWKPKKDEEDEEDEEDQPDEEYKEDGEQEDEEQEDGRESTDETPIVRARGVDFAMLLHEAVKGIFEFLSLAGLPVVKDDDDKIDSEKTKELLQKIYANTGMSDEPQDFKYGPEIAADLRDFVNVNDKIDTYPNIREELWKVMIHEKTMPTAKFLELMRGILSKTKEARTQVDVLINQVIEKIKNEKSHNSETEKWKKDMEKWKKDMEEYNKNKGKEELEPAEGDDDDDNYDDETDKLVKQSLYGKKDDEKPKDYKSYLKTLSQADLIAEMDVALGDHDLDIERCALIRSFMEGQSSELYRRELKIVNEKLNLHTK